MHQSQALVHGNDPTIAPLAISRLGVLEILTYSRVRCDSCASATHAPTALARCCDRFQSQARHLLE